MKTIKMLSVICFLLITTISVRAQGNAVAKPTIIFVHGIWADGSSWITEINALQAKGYHVVSVQNPVTSLADDVAATKRAIELAPGKVILVGHSWGGFVITQAGNDPKVAGLVYVAAFAPATGENVKTLSANGPGTDLMKYFVISKDGYIFLTMAGIKTVFAADLTPKQQSAVFAVQTPANHTVFDEKLTGAPAWQTKPSWYIVSKNDKAINPALERFMSKRIKAKTIEIASSHVAMVAHPKEVLAVIEEAATAKK